jgi:cold shock CspA family protein
MLGTMLWFNVDKGFGFICTESKERLYVARTGFQSGHAPAPRCRGREVTFDRCVSEGDTRAVNVAFVITTEPRRARRRQSRGGHTASRSN